MSGSAGIAGLILAAGASRRMGSPKALLTIDGETFLDHLVAALEAHCAPVLVVLGFHADRIRAGIRRTAGVTFVTNPDPDRGMLSSLQCGLAEVPPAARAVLFTPVDYPRIAPGTVAALAAEFARHPDAPVIVPTHEGRRGHPVLIHRDLAAEILALPPDAQARDVIRAHRPRTCNVPVDDPGILRDIDTPEEYAVLTAES